MLPVCASDDIAKFSAVYPLCAFALLKRSALAPGQTEGIYAALAQLVEQLICNQQVVGSTPARGSIL